MTPTPTRRIDAPLICVYQNADIDGEGDDRIPAGTARPYQATDVLTEVYLITPRDPSAIPVIATPWTWCSIAAEMLTGPQDPRARDYASRGNRPLRVGDVMAVDHPVNPACATAPVRTWCALATDGSWHPFDAGQYGPWQMEGDDACPGAVPLFHTVEGLRDQWLVDTHARYAQDPAWPAWLDYVSALIQHAIPHARAAAIDEDPWAQLPGQGPVSILAAVYGPDRIAADWPAPDAYISPLGLTAAETRRRVNELLLDAQSITSASSLIGRLFTLAPPPVLDVPWTGDLTGDDIGDDIGDDGPEVPGMSGAYDALGGVVSDADPGL